MEPFLSDFSPSVFVSPLECNSKATLAAARWVVIHLMVAGLTRICAAAAEPAAAKSYSPCLDTATLSMHNISQTWDPIYD